MANQEHLDILKQGVEVWNEWRKENADIRPDLGGADLKNFNLIGANLSYANLVKIDLREADLRGANLRKADLIQADLAAADLRRADLTQADVTAADLREADLRGIDLTRTYLRETVLRGANLSGGNLSRALLVETNLSEATLTNCNIYGISVWNVDLQGAKQNNLIITPLWEPTITVDSLDIAQFIYLLLNNPKIREVIDTITSKVVLILGRFTPKRKAILDALKNELRHRNYSPVVFDFEKPASRDITETISTLAHLARFVIADITDAKSIPQELMLIVPNLPSVPVQPLILSSQHEYGMFEHFTRYPWVLPVYRYTDETSLLEALQENIIAPVEQKARELNQS